MYRTTSNQAKRYLIGTLFFSLIFYVISLSPAMAADIFKCVKPDGEVEYTQSPTADCQAQKIKTHSGQADKNAQEKFKLDQEERRLSAEKENAEKLKQQDLEKQKKEKEEYCSELKSNLGRILSTHRVLKTDEDGNTVALDEEQRQQRIQESNEKIAEHCS